MFDRVGRGPNGLAAAALYLVGTHNGEISTQHQIASASGVSGVTIRNRIKGLSKSTLKKYMGVREMKINT